MTLREQIEEIVNRETRAWDTQGVDLLLSVFHPDMVWPWPPTADSHDPEDWIWQWDDSIASVGEIHGESCSRLIDWSTISERFAGLKSQPMAMAHLPWLTSTRCGWLRMARRRIGKDALAKCMRESAMIGK
jgi:hypothetical protein